MPQKQTLNELDRVLAVILFDRASAHMTAGRYRQALPLLRTLVLEFPADWAAREALVRLHLTLARDYRQKKDPLRSADHLAQARSLAPDNPRVREFAESMDQGMQPVSCQFSKDRVRWLARNFLLRHYPGQARWFELAWRVFEPMDPSTFNVQALSGALGAVGEEENGRVAAQVVVMLSAAVRTHADGTTLEGLDMAIRRVGGQVGADRELISRLVRHTADALHGHPS